MHMHFPVYPRLLRITNDHISNTTVFKFYNGHRCVFNGVGERFRHAPWGLAGGKPGEPRRFAFVGANGDETPLPGKTGDRIVPEGAAALIDSPGAGGWGAPADEA